LLDDARRSGFNPSVTPWLDLLREALSVQVNPSSDTAIGGLRKTVPLSMTEFLLCVNSCPNSYLR